MRDFFQKRWNLIKTDSVYRSGFRLASIVFSVLMFCFLSLPSCTYSFQGVTVELSSASEIFCSGFSIAGVEVATSAGWQAFIGYVVAFIMGLTPFLVLYKKPLLFCLICSILAFVLVATQPILTILSFSRACEGGSIEFGVGYLLPLIFSLFIVVSLAVVYVVPPKGGWNSEKIEAK